MDLTHSSAPIVRFLASELDRNTLGLVYGRRRIGKSALLAALTLARKGFYWEATRSELAIHLARLGEALGAHLGVGPLATGWEDALTRLLHLGATDNTPVVLNEFGYLLEAEPGLDSIIATLLGPSGRDTGGQARLILCGSAIP